MPSRGFTPIWSGLWSLKHRDRLGKAVFMFGYLVQIAHLKARDTGILTDISYESLLEGLSEPDPDYPKIPIRTIERDFAVLRKEGYIIVKYGPGGNGKIASVKIANWRSITGKDFGKKITQELPKKEAEVPDTSGGELLDGNKECPTLMSKVPDTFVVAPRHLCRAQSPQAPNKTDSSKGLKKVKKVKKKRLQVPVNSAKKTPAKKTTNPDIKILIDFYFNEVIRLHSFKPETGGKAGKIFERLLKSREAEDVKKLLTDYLSLDDDFVKKAGYALEIFPTRINALLLKDSKGDPGSLPDGKVKLAE